MASPAKLAAMAASMAVGLLYVAAVCTMRIRRNEGKTEFARADLAESEEVRRQLLWGALIFAVLAVVMLIVWAI
ncbi:MAG: hypothetical protein JST73_05230 [Actinobacteria bacterium]|nr:hypothetical protein [Actinomycetota bacterium]